MRNLPIIDLGRVFRLDVCRKQKDMCWGYDGFVLAHKDINPDFDEEKPFIVVIDQDGAWQMHFENFGTMPKNEKILDDMYKAVSASCKKGTELELRGGATPGGLSGFSKLQNYGFKKAFLPDDTNVYWGGELDPARLETWLNSGRHDNEFLVMDGDKFISPVEYDGEITAGNTKPRPFKMVKESRTGDASRKFESALYCLEQALYRKLSDGAYRYHDIEYILGEIQRMWNAQHDDAGRSAVLAKIQDPEAFIKYWKDVDEGIASESKRQILYWAHMLDECFNKERFICEDREGRNINRTEKWIKQNHPEVIGQKLEDGTAITPRILTQEIRNTVPNVRMADCKFLIGATRMYFDLQNDAYEFQSRMNKLNKMLKIICTAHADEYDSNFNNLSFDELDKKFSGAAKKELDNDREQIGKLQLIKNTTYKIVPIDSFDEASKYGKYTSWCVTHYPDMYSNYTKNGLGRFYFCLQDGFENVPKVNGEGCPMDTYGKSMIAISVNDDGSLNTCTCRWNHNNDGNDNMMDTKEISKFFGVDFYKTFKPYDTDELWKKILAKQVPLRGLNDDDAEFCRTFDCIAIYANDDEDDSSVVFKKLIDGKIITLPRINKTTTYINNKFVTMKDSKFVVVAPNIIQYMPKDIKGDFIIPNGVISIGRSVFSGCSGITSVTIPNSVTSIGDEAFYGCSGLTSITIPSGVMSIGKGAFRYCCDLTSVTIGNNVASIGDETFYSCDRLTSVTIGNNVASIGNKAFSCCRGLANVTIPDSVESIGDYAFYYCGSLTSMTIGNGVMSIGYHAFSWCSGLTRIIFKGKTLEEVKAMENYPFGIENESIITCEDNLNESKATQQIRYWAHMFDECSGI